MADAPTSKSTPPPVNPELIEVREGEDFDHAKLAAWLKGRLEGSDAPLQVRQFGGGHANLTYRLSFGEGPDAVEYVLRRPPLGPVAARAHDMHREYRALSKLWRGFPKAPRAYLYCDDPSIIGADFLVMERRHGVVVRNVVPEAFGGGRDPVANRKLSEVVIDTLAEFHGVSPASVDLEDLGKPEGFLERQVRGWIGRYEKARTHDVAVAEEVSRWLIDQMPRSPAATLVHNDWKLDNMAVAPDDPGRCVAVYDWDMCTVGDPLCDVGTLFATWSDPGEGPGGASPMPTQSEGFMSRSDAVKRYAERSGTDVVAIPYYTVFGCYKMAVVLQQIFVRYHRGQTRDERFAGMGAAAENLFQIAAERRP
jgi:aminoglycoside phosphotransferase (APT) family kinase protein